MDNLLYLNDTWSCYFHNPLDEDWRNESYKKMLDIGSAFDFWGFNTVVKENITKGMFFIMREHIFPCWDDVSNINGGCISMKIQKVDMLNFWELLSSMLLTETLLLPEYREKHWNMINGISTSPKRSFCIVKIWVGTHELSNVKMFNLPCDYSGELIFKTNISNISSENIRLNTKTQVPNMLPTLLHV
jgi:hypothetical protein